MTMEFFSVNHITLCVDYLNGCSYKEPKKMFHKRQEFAKENSFLFFGKKYSELNFNEKFNITYMVTNTNPLSSMKDFIMESGFRNLHKNQKDEILNYQKVEFLKRKLEFNNEEKSSINKERIMIIQKLLDQTLKLNFTYKIYLGSIKKPPPNLKESDIISFKKMLNNPENREIINKLNQKLLLNRECVSACIITNALKYVYTNVDDYWPDLIKSIRKLKLISKNTTVTREMILKVLDRFYYMDENFANRPVDKRIDKHRMNKILLEKVSEKMGKTKEEIKKISKG